MFASIIDVLRRFINSGKDSSILFVKQQKNTEFIELTLIRKLNMFYKYVIAELPGEPLSFRNVYILESGIWMLFWCLGMWWRRQNNIYWWQCEISASGKPIRISLNSYKNFPCKSIIGLTLYNSTISAKSCQKSCLWADFWGVSVISRAPFWKGLPVLILCWASLHSHKLQWALSSAQHLPGKSPSWICTYKAAY